MTLTRWRVEKVSGSELSFPVPKTRALTQIRNRMEREPLGDPLKIVRVEYRLNPEEPPATHTGPMRRVWRETVVRYPDIGTLGVYVCKDGSQHRFGNAGDWAAALAAKTTQQIIDYLWEVAKWHRAQGLRFATTGGEEGLPTSEVIFRDRIATRSHAWAWRHYGGVLHAAHVHTSCYPLVDTSRPCG